MDDALARFVGCGVASAGFEKIEQRIDEWGIFTVSVARRLPT